MYFSIGVMDAFLYLPTFVCSNSVSVLLHFPISFEHTHLHTHKVGEDGAMMVTGGHDATCRIWVIDHDSLASALMDGYVQSSLGT